MKKTFALLIFVAVTLVGARLNGESIPDTLNRYLLSAAADGQINGSTLIGENGRILYQTNFGYAKIDKKTPITDGTLFPLASISKPFTAVAILQLKEQGKLRLDDPLANYLKNFPYPTITIRQLLSHTAGLPDKEAVFDPLIANNPDRIIGLDDVMPAVIAYQKTNSLLFKPGDKWAYSSIGYSLLALLVQQLSGMSFADYVHRNIFMPAGMKNSYIQTNLSQAAESNRTVNYIYNNHFEMKLEQADKLPDRREWTYNLTGLMGGNNVVSSAPDLFRFDQALYSNVLLKPETLEEAFTPVKLNNGENNKAVPGTSCGLGWFIFDDTSNGKIVWHSGSVPGVTTLFVRNLETKQCFVVLLNVACSMGVYADMLDIINNKPDAYRPSLAFIYGRDLFLYGVDYATCHFNQLKGDTVHYSLKELEMDRVGLEFSRVPKLSNFSLETYKINTLLFPTSWQVYENYGDNVWKQTKNKDAAVMAYKTSLSLNPTNEVVQKTLNELSSK